MTGTNNRKLLAWRKTFLDAAGGLQAPSVQNQERLYLMEEETRNSIMIEGYFSDKKTLKEVIAGKNTTADHADKISGYFDAASLIYEYAYQKWQENEGGTVRGSDIKTIHSLMFKPINPSIAGKRRSGDMMITGAKIKTLSGMLVEKGIQYLIAYVDQQAKGNDIIDLVAKMHVLFEAIHPFEDGNGRVGRILINYLLVSQGYPNIIIKGTDKAKKKYFEALEEGEKGLYTYFPDAIPGNDWDTTGDFSLLKDILYTSLFSSMDRVILHSSENIETLISVVSICEKYGYSDEYARKLVQRGGVVAVKKDNTRYTKEAYFYKPLKHKHDK